MSDSTALDLDPAEIAVLGDGGALLVALDEETAIELFREWHRRESRRYRRQSEVESRRAAFRVVERNA